MKQKMPKAKRTLLRPDSLAFSLAAAAQAITDIRAGSALPQALTHAVAQTEASITSRGAIQDITYRATRQLGLTDALLQLLVDKKTGSPLLHSLLQCALALLVTTREVAERPPYEAFTVVDQAVTAAATHPETAHAKGMVNAVLRRFIREKAALELEARQQSSALWNYPEWWIDTTKSAYPESWENILDTGNATPPLILRVNQRRLTIDAYLRTLADHGIAARQVGPAAVRLDKPLPVDRIPGFSSGDVSVQDTAAQLAAPLLDLRDGLRVLDACAAPGGKTGHLLECAAIDLVALDHDAERLERVRQNLRRLQLDAVLKTGDAAAQDWWDGTPFDRILADVPCTASGIVRRHPDIRWLRRPGDAVRLATLSSRILDNLWQMLRPDGKLLFVTCSLWPQESETQAATFAVRHGAVRLHAPGQLLPTANMDDDHDGLFYALFQKPAI